MAMFYMASYDVSELSTLGTLTLATAGETDVVITLKNITATAGDGSTSSLFTHGIALSDMTSQGAGGASVLQDHSATPFGGALQAALRAEATTQSWSSPNNISAYLTVSTGLFTIAYSGANITLTWSAAAGRNFLGFSGTQSGAQSYASDQTPDYIISPTLQRVSEPTPHYEPDGIASRATADDGTGFGIARTESPLHCDWVQQYETKEKTRRLFAASSHPWTFQEMFEHCRTVFPFVVINGFNNDGYYEAFALREDGSSFKPERATPGNDLQHHVPFRTHVLGRAGA